MDDDEDDVKDDGGITSSSDPTCCGDNGTMGVERMALLTTRRAGFRGLISTPPFLGTVVVVIIKGSI